MYCSVWGLFSFGQRAGASHFPSCSNTPGGWPSRPCLPTPQAVHIQPVRLTLRAWEAGFLPFLWPVVCLCLQQPGTLHRACCGLSEDRSGWRMQADKYRTSGRNDKKELVIESPLQYKDSAQGDVEAAESVVLVRLLSPLGL